MRRSILGFLACSLLTGAAWAGEPTAAAPEVQVLDPTVADATALCAVDFAKWSDVEIPPECRNLGRWYEAVSSRPSAKA